MFGRFLTNRFVVFFREAITRQREVDRFNGDRGIRRKRYKHFNGFRKVDSSIIRSLNKHGFAIIKDAIDKKLLLRIKFEFEEHLNNGTCLNTISKDSARVLGDTNASTVFLKGDELLKGQDYFRQHTNYVSVNDPLLNYPSTIKAAFAECLIDIATLYLKCIPAIGSLNLRKSFANNLPEFDTLYFHSDLNSPKFLKFFFYLNDVDENGGPFCYVKGSHKKKFRGWKRKYRWTFEEICTIYGKERIINLTADLGDLIVANTTGFHRGTKVRTNDRVMLTVDYVIQEEFGGKSPRFKLLRADYESLSSKQKAAADFLEVVDGESCSHPASSY